MVNQLGNEENKVCKKCHLPKKLVEFGFDKTKTDGLAERCRLCKRLSRAPSKAKMPAIEATKQRKLQSEAWYTAVDKLIEIHKTQFIKLLYSEQVRANLINPKADKVEYETHTNQTRVRVR